VNNPRGWSLGGVIAREAAREAPSLIRHVVTIGSPVFGGPKYTALARIYRARGVDLDAIEKAINAPNRKDQESNGRVRHWGWIAELGHWLRVVTLADGETVHTAMLDRDFEP
jgi:pimeloyl-ACP methyl ester carboxylesterase